MNKCGNFFFFFIRRCHRQLSKCTTLFDKNFAPPHSTHIICSPNMNSPGWCRACLFSPLNHVVDPDLALEGARNLVGKWSGRLNLGLSLSQALTYVSRVGRSGRVRRSRFGKEEGRSCIHENCFSAACERV